MGRKPKYTIESLERTISLLVYNEGDWTEKERLDMLKFYRKELAKKKKVIAKTEDDNAGKIGSRSYIATQINDHFKSEDRYAISMFDFLGGGVGAEYYLKNIDKLLVIDLLDNKKDKVKDFLLNSYKRLVKETDKYIHVYNLDVNDFLVNVNTDPYDVLNLDFCAYFYENGTPNSTKGIIETAFKNNSVAKNGVMLCTFQIKGYGINMQMNRQKITIDPKDICKQVKELAVKYGYEIQEEICYEYRSSVSSRMLNVAFRLGE